MSRVYLAGGGPKYEVELPSGGITVTSKGLQAIRCHLRNPFGVKRTFAAQGIMVGFGPLASVSGKPRLDFGPGASYPLQTLQYD